MRGCSETAEGAEGMYVLRGLSGTGGISLPADCCPLSLCPQFSQKCESGSISAPQFGQCGDAGSGAGCITFPHSGQNFESSGISAPQFSQYIFYPPKVSWGSSADSMRSQQ